MATLALSSSYTSTSRPLTSKWLGEGTYVVAIAALQSHYAALAIAATDSSAIHIFDNAQGGSALVRTIPGHERGTSSICTASEFATNRDVLLSCGKDGTVSAWDVRANNATPSVKSEYTLYMRL